MLSKNGDKCPLAVVAVGSPRPHSPLPIRLIRRHQIRLRGVFVADSRERTAGDDIKQDINDTSVVIKVKGSVEFKGM